MLLSLGSNPDTTCQECRWLSRGKARYGKAYGLIRVNAGLAIGLPRRPKLIARRRGIAGNSSQPSEERRSHATGPTLYRRSAGLTSSPSAEGLYSGGWMRARPTVGCPGQQVRRPTSLCCLHGQLKVAIEDLGEARNLFRQRVLGDSPAVGEPGNRDGVAG